MPTIARFGAFHIVLYPSDHDPAHVHAISSDAEIIINLSDPLELRSLEGKCSPGALKKLLREVAANREVFLQKWQEYHDRL